MWTNPFFKNSRYNSVAQKWVPGHCVHTVFVSSRAVHYFSLFSLLSSCQDSKWRLTGRNGVTMNTVSYRVVKLWTQHHFVPVPRHWFPGSKCGQALSTILKSTIRRTLLFEKTLGEWLVECCFEAIVSRCFFLWLRFYAVPGSSVTCDSVVNNRHKSQKYLRRISFGTFRRSGNLLAITRQEWNHDWAQTRK